ncbi:MAG TPA: single-stranded-DNA-specific exonuclease RecJ [Bacteroidales bacterium]|nr:single-stranded-DNA-specific exonuclease RecJ [Bacteroidales bacterium]HPS15866.1 single-stranded-DNA-specific exonuclease RecJ [Bacteroidales bacterium]
MTKRWVIKKQSEVKAVQSLAKEINVSMNIANLLIQRGIDTFEKAKKFFRPELTDLHDPFLMKDMNIAIARIEEAIKANEKILVYGDYDVDGTSAVALVYSFLKDIYPAENLDFYIPDRYNEGYGISFRGINFAADNGFKLIICLDCGIKATEQITFAKGKGIDFIICDHHRPGDQLPPAVAILDPKRSDCTYPYNELSGCGIGFKLAQAYAQKNNIPFKKIEKLLDLVVVSIASDIVSITGENRILAYFGLKKLNSKPRPGFEAVLNFSGVKRQGVSEDEQIFSRLLNINDLVFLVGPRINAAGRIENGRNAVKLLISENLAEAMQLGESINDNNTERRSLDTTITQAAIDMLYSDVTHKNKKTTVIFHPEWHKGVVGIVASRLIETYYRPTIVLTESNGIITGSARSVKDFDIYDAIDACSDLLEHFGGHKYAAGLSLKPENLNAFCEKFERIVSETITDEMLVPEIEIDSELELTDISPRFYKILKQFAPFGPGNMAPVFLTHGLVDKGFARIVGLNHLRFCAIYPGIYKPEYNAIGFGLSEHLPLVSSGKPFSLCYHIDENEWNGNVSLQLVVKDIKADKEL